MKSLSAVVGCVGVLLAILWVGLDGVAPAGASPPPNTARESGPLTLVNQLGGVTEAIAVEGERLYIGRGPRIVAYDVSDPTAPVQLARSEPLSVRPKSMHLAGDTLLVAGPGLIAAYDVSVETTISATALITMTASAVDLAVAGNYAFVAEALPGGVRVMDISDPTNLEEVAYQTLGRSLRNMAWSDGYLYGATDRTSRRYFIVDVNDPLSPALVVDTDAPLPFSDVAVAGDHLYATREIDDNIQSYSLISPTNPILEAHVDLSANGGFVTVSGTHAYVTGSPDAMMVVDISNPAAPAELGAWQSSFSGLLDIAVAGNSVFLANFGGGVPIVDVSDPQAPAESATIDVLGYLQSGTIGQNHLFAPDAGDEIAVVDLRDPEAPAPVAAFDSPAFRLEAAGTYLFGIWETGPGNAGVHIYDIANPTSPQLLGNIPTDSAPGMAVRLPYLFLGRGSGGLEVYDVSTPAAPQLVGSLPSFNGFAVQLAGNRAFLYEPGSQIVVADVGDPGNPEAIGTIPIDFDMTALPYDGATLFLFEPGFGLTILDITDLNQPQEIAFLSITENNPATLSRVGNKLILTRFFDATLVVDITDLAAPEIVQEIQQESGIGNVAGFLGPYIFTAGIENGVLVYRDATGLTESTFLPLIGAGATSSASAALQMEK